MSLRSFIYQLGEYAALPLFPLAIGLDMATNWFEPDITEEEKEGEREGEREGEGEENKTKKRPILLLHGKSANRAQWALVYYWLRSFNVGPIYSLNYVLDDEGAAHLLSTPRKRTLDEMADVVVLEIEKILRDTGADEIILVGHSMGGIVASIVAEEREIGAKVAKVVTCGSPFQGSALVEKLNEISSGLFTEYVSPSVVLKEMVRVEDGHGERMDQLCQKIAKGDSGTRYLFIGGKHDIMVAPERAIPSGLDPTGYHQSMVVRSGHFGFVYPRSYSLWRDHIIPFIKND